MLILFRDHFFDMPDRQRVKARRRLGFGFGMITSDLDAPPSKGDSAVKAIIFQIWRVKNSSDQATWFWSSFSVHFYNHGGNRPRHNGSESRVLSCFQFGWTYNFHLFSPIYANELKYKEKTIRIQKCICLWINPCNTKFTERSNEPWLAR